MAKLIKVSEAASLALHAMVLMAAESLRPLSTAEIASRLVVSEAHLSKVLQRLGRAGLVKSLRGPRGGFVLARGSGAMTLRDVYEAIEGKCEPSGCLFGSPACGLKRCILSGVVEKVDGQLRRYLARTRLSDVAGVFAGKGVREKKNNRD